MANEKRLIDAYEADPRNLAFPIHVDGSEYSPYERGYNDAVVSCFGLLMNAPTVDAVEVVHAKWENVQNGKGCCSNCHRLDGIDNLATHCRYCGAKMDGDGNG